MTGNIQPAEAEKIYDGVVDLNAKNNSHTIAYQLIESGTEPGKRATILEVGCASGYFGQVLKEAGHNVWGVEISAKAAAIAQRRLDHVHIGDIDSFLESPAAREQKFDFITFGDVLEHLPDPENILRRCRDILVPEGRVIASIPNVAHLSVRLMLLEGRWEYSKLGILDDTHLRFFTRASLTQMFSETGYAIEAHESVRLPLDTVSEIYGIEINPGLRDAVEPLLKDNEKDVFQYLIMARRTDTPEAVARNERFLPAHGLHVLCLLPMVDWSLSEIRIQSPLENWTKRHGGEARVRSVFRFEHDDLMWADIVVFQREANVYTIGLIRFLQEHGKRVIFDIDDLLTEVPSFLSVYEHHLATRGFLMQALQQVDAVTVTTQRLAERLGQFSDSVQIVPNCSAPLGKPARHYEDSQNPVTLIVASSDTVRVDFVIPALKKVLADPEIRVRLIAIGPPADFLKQAGFPVESFDNMGYEQFRLFIASRDNAIGIIPLDDSEFSSCKSVIKYLDYAMAGVPSICSNVPPYSDVIENNATGLLAANDDNSWYLAIKVLAGSHQERARIVDGARQYCQMNLSTKVSADAWQNVLSGVMSKKVRIEGRESEGRHEDRTVFHFISRTRLAYLLRHLTRPRSYLTAVRLVHQLGFRYTVKITMAQLAYGKEPTPVGKAAISTAPAPIALQSPRTAPLATGEADRVSRVEVLFFTYQRSNPGTVTLRIMDEQGNALREATANGDALKDGAYHTFRLDTPLQRIRGENLNVEVSFRANGKKSMVAVQGPADSVNRGFTHRIK